jgi:hypothetical protein
MTALFCKYITSITPAPTFSVETAEKPPAPERLPEEAANLELITPSRTELPESVEEPPVEQTRPIEQLVNDPWSATEHKEGTPKEDAMYDESGLPNPSFQASSGDAWGNPWRPLTNANEDYENPFANKEDQFE